jgi:hypothetical protein
MTTAGKESPRTPHPCSVIVGTVDPEHPRLPLEHLDRVRAAISQLIPSLLHSMGIRAVISEMEVWQDSRYHYLEVQLALPQPSAQSSLFAEMELDDLLPEDIGRALAAETRELLCRLLTHTPVTLGELSRASGRESSALKVPVQVARLVRKAPRSTLSWTTHGVRHDIDLGVADSVVEHPAPVRVNATVKAIGPSWVFVERLTSLSPLGDVKLPKSGWVFVPKSTEPAVMQELEQACKELRSHNFCLRVWFHRVKREVKGMHLATLHPA